MAGVIVIGGGMGGLSTALLLAGDGHEVTVLERDFAVVPDQFVTEGDTVVALGNYTWKHKGSREPPSVKVVHVWTPDDGKAVAFQQHVDTVRVRELS